VVAEEVRNLAARSQVSAKETNDLISNSIQRVEEGTRIAESTAHTLDTMISDFNSVTQIIEKIAAASSEQAELATQISKGIIQISKITQDNSAASQETAAASHVLANQAETLLSLVKEA
jgi:methyl-accepting chemotaxis protein